MIMLESNLLCILLSCLQNMGKITVLQRADKKRVLYFKDVSPDAEYKVEEGKYPPPRLW